MPRFVLLPLSDDEKDANEEVQSDHALSPPWTHAQMGSVGRGRPAQSESGQRGRVAESEMGSANYRNLKV